MIVNARKICDACHDIVAEKAGIRFYTKKKYITIRSDAISCYFGDATLADKLHYCYKCWDKIVAKIEVQDF